MASTMMAASVGERIRDAVESKKFAVRRGRTVEVGVSMGIACFPSDGETTEELLSAAARNMQKDKHARKNIATLSATPTAMSIDVLG
jgi:diguanylate cyclase (GGDEF)-like protein